MSTYLLDGHDHWLHPFAIQGAAARRLLRNNNYPAADGGTVYALAFTAEEIDYLDSRASGEARQTGEVEGASGGKSAAPDSAEAATGTETRSRKARTGRQAEQLKS